MSMREAGGQPATAAATLDLLQRARDECLQVVEEGMTQTHVLGLLQPALEGQFKRAANNIAALRLSLAVVGGEGAGKSTLIAAVLGSDVVPRDERPGTVAPVYLEGGRAPYPVYSVVRAGLPGEVPCTDEVEFAHYLLVQHNEMNHKGVQAGYIRWQHPLLQRGLVMAELPGGYGVASGIRHQLKDFLRKCASAVVGITRDNDVSSLVRIAEALSPQGMGMAMDAIIANSSRDHWIAESALYPTAEAFVARERERTVRSIEAESAEIRLVDDAVYVLHLPSVYEEAARRTPAVTSPAHEAERARFERDFWSHVQINGLKEVVYEAARRAERALLELDVALAKRQGVLERYKEEFQLVDAFHQSRVAAEERWGEAYNDEVVEAVANEHWQSFKGAVEGARSRAVEKISEIGTKVQSQEGKIRTFEAQMVWRDLTDLIASEEDVLADKQAQLLDQVSDYYWSFAIAALDELFSTVREIRDAVPEEMSGAMPVVTPWRIGNLPVAPVVERLIKGDRQPVVNSLDEAREWLLGIDISDTGEVHAEWLSAVKTVADSVDAHLRKRISELGMLIASPRTAEPGVEHAEIDAARATVKGLISRLNTIVGLPE